MEGSSASERKALRDVNAYLATALGPQLEEVFDNPGERRVQAVGQMGILPLLATPVAGRALGSSPEIAYRHPKADAAFRPEGVRGSVELLVVDKCFKGDAQKVEITAGLAPSRQSAESQILTFNSETSTLPVDKLISALKSVSSAIVFCHAESPVANASAAGLVLGPSSRLTVDMLASFDLNGLEELALIGCASGRSNPFVGEATLAHAAALAGAGEILYTLWPIRPGDGAGIVVGMLESRGQGQTMRKFLARQFEEDPLKAAPFAVMRP